MITVETYADLPKKLGHHGLVVLVLLQAADMMGIEPVTAKWIHQHSPRYGINSITAALELLEAPENQYAIRVKGGWKFNREQAFQLPLGYTLTDSEPVLVSENHSGSDSPDKKDGSEPDFASENHSGSDFEAEIIEDEVIQIDENHSGSDSCLENTPENHSGSDFRTRISLKYLRAGGGGEDNLKTSTSPPELKGELAENRNLLEHSALLFGEPGVLVDKLDQEFLSTIPAEIVRGWLNQAYFLRSKNKLTSPAGYVFAGLQKYPEEKPKAKFTHAAEDAFLPEEYLVEIGVKRKTCNLCQDDFDSWAAYEAHLDECKKSPRAGEGDQDLAPLEPDESVTEQVIQVWESVLEEIRKDMPKASFETWVRGAYPFRHRDGVLSIAVGNSYAKDWLTTNLQGTCERLLGGKQVRFVVSP